MNTTPVQGLMPLQGFTVLDLSQGVAGPYCAQLLAGQGARVIKVEPPQGDWGRHVGVASDGHSTISSTYNSGKQSLAIDARRPEGRAVILRLAERADVIVQNFRPQVVERLGLDYESLRARGLGPVYVSISGYGPDGPFADHPATDSVMQADSGLMHTNRDAGGTPQRIGLLLADIAAGVYAAQACTAALLHRTRTAEGSHVQISLFNVCCALQSTVFSEELTGAQAARQTVSAPNGIFDAADGKLTILALNNEQFLRICKAFGLQHWETDPRFASNALRLEHKALLHAELSRKVAPQSLAQLEALLGRYQVLHARVREGRDVVEHPQARHLHTFQTIEQPGFGPLLWAAAPWACHVGAAQPAPRIGEHSQAILHGLGLDAQEIAALVAQQVVAV
ncbi:CaiB/BaiF CoA transferase family protein [Alicycliphilus denitrificans]|uniref:CaiB/BaiF CoA transferase family protein n=1 Tax=Alicycliphilus denitrificans TaxID=179636 RepID=UPI003A7FE44A